MPNVDKELHNPETANANLIRERTSSKPKRSLRGAAGGTYVGPVLSTAAIGDSGITHATGIAAGGVEDSTGFRRSDTFRMGTAEDVAVATSRPNPGAGPARTMYRSDGTFGGSVVGYPSQRVGQRAAAAAGSSLSAEGAVGAFIDKRSNIYGDGGEALGSAGRGTRVLAGVVVKGANVGQASGQPRMDAPLIGGASDPAAGTVAVIAAVGKVQADLNAADITAGASGMAGCVIYIFARGTDTDEDVRMVRKGDFDSTTAGDVTGLTGMTAGTYSCYAAFKDAAGNIGPWSARGTVVVS